MSLAIAQYPIHHPLLASLVKYCWVIDSDEELVVDHTLLPVCNIDLILNLSAPITYHTDAGVVATPTGCHFNGMRERPLTIRQRGKLKVIGIAFQPLGLYPFLKTPLAEFAHATVELDLIDESFSAGLMDRLFTDKPLHTQLALVEEALVRCIDIDLLPDAGARQVVSGVAALSGAGAIAELSEAYGMHPRTLERLFGRHVGISPKVFQRLNRFRRVLQLLIAGNYGTLSALAQDGDYYDQMHFIRDFKAFAGSTPTQFLLHRRAVKACMTPRT